jgi:hypothetical protein
MEKTGIYGGLEIRDFIKNFSEWTAVMLVINLFYFWPIG